MTTRKLFVNNAADTLKELLSFHHRIKSAWKQAYGTEDTPVVELRLHWYLIPNLLPCKLKKNFLKEPSRAQKMSPAPDTNLDTYNSVQRAKLKTEQELLQLCQGCGSFPFLISIIYLSHSIVPIIKMGDVGYLQELHPLTIHSSRSWNHEWKIQQVIKHGGRS